MSEDLYARCHYCKTKDQMCSDTKAAYNCPRYHAYFAEIMRVHNLISETPHWTGIKIIDARLPAPFVTAR